MDINVDIHFLYTQFINLSICVQIIYISIAAFFVFIIWRSSTDPISRINHAIWNNDISTVKKCLEEGVDANLQDGNGISLLYSATTKNYQEIARTLIDYGANVNQGLNEEYGRNPLLASAINNQSDFIEMLLANGAKTGIHFAALQGDFDTVKLFLDRQIFPINSNRNYGKTPLNLAASGGHLKIVELLLDRGAIFDSLHYSQTPLYQAVYFNHLEVVDLLIDRGADPNHACALYMATRRNYLEMVKRLVERGVDVNYQDNDFKSSPLHAAADLNIAEFLIKNGAQVNAKSKSDASTPLHNAAENGCVEVAELLIANGAEVNTHGGSNGGTPLLYAAQKGHLLMVKLLIRNGANINSGNLTTTPLDWARSNGHWDVVQLLNSYGAIYGLLD